MFGNKNVRAAKKAVKRLDVEGFNSAMTGFPEDRKQEFLNDALVRIINRSPAPETESFVAALLKAGADVNQRIKGIIIVRAIETSQPTAVVKLIHDKGCSFDDALDIMQKNRWGASYIESLKHEREKITGSREKIVPAPQGSDEAKFHAQVLERLDNLAAQFNDIAGRLARIEAAAGIGHAGKPARAAKAAYPDVG